MDVALLIARIGLGAIFAIAGLAKLADRRGAVRRVAWGLRDSKHRLQGRFALLLTLAAVAILSASEARAAVTSFGSAGSGNGQFLDPAGVAVDGTGNVYVADRNNHRIEAFTNSGTFIRTWGSLGTGDGEFGYPVGIAVSPGGQVYVSELPFNSNV